MATITKTIRGRRARTAGALVAGVSVLLAASLGRAQCSPVDIGTDESVVGTLTAGDCTIAQLGVDPDDDSFVDVYRVVLPTSGSLTVELQSSDFDSYLELADEFIVDLIAYDDDGGSGFDSIILDVNLDAGTYIILANNFGLTGAYTLTTTSAQTNSACDVVVNLSTNALAQGILSQGDCTLASLVPGEDTSYVDRYRVTLPSGGDLTILLESNAFDTFLWLLDDTLSEVIATNDDDGSSSNSSLSNLILDPGSYVILANSFSVGGLGSYDLTLIPEPSATLLCSFALGTLMALSHKGFRQRRRRRDRSMDF